MHKDENGIVMITQRGKTIVQNLFQAKRNKRSKGQRPTGQPPSGRKLTITLVTDTFNMHNNGITISAMRLAEGLSGNGHQLRILTCGNPLESGIDPVNGFDMYYVPELHIPLASYFAHKQDTRFGRPDRDVITRAITGADLVHIFQPWPMNNMARKIAAQLGIPAIAAFHIQPENVTYNIGLGWFAPAAHLVYALFRICFYAKFKHIHCPSKFIAAQLRSHNYRAWLHVVSNGVHPSFHPHPNPAQEASESTPLPELNHMLKERDGLIRILMIGRLSPEKRQDVLIRAAAKSRYANRIELHFAGAGPWRKKLERMGKKLANPPVFGYYTQQELIQLIYNCDLYVHASDIEIEGISCLEALSCGLVPIIANSKKSATTQFALHEKSLFRAGRPGSLAETIDFWIEHDALRQGMSKSYAVFGQKYSINSCVRQMENNYHKLFRTQKNVYHHSNFFQISSRIFYTVIVIPVLFVWTRLILGVRVKGRKNMGRFKGALTLCNHVHMLDSALVSLVLFPRKLVFPTISQNMETLWPGKMVKLLGGVVIPGNISELKDFMNEMELLLAKGRVIHFFPEGELNPYDTKLRNFKKGAFYLASQARVPIVPMSISFRKPKGIYKLIRNKPTMVLHVGKPIQPMSADSPDDLRLRMQLAQKQMSQLIEKAAGSE